ncbi:restriction endonuclease subunit S [Pectinatus frisingensis]|uniref:restriction endonuclease subunit S n=1 Tax=Pectinatus frisingensis TaxID=865 RepID=UPI003D8028BD
MIADKLRKSVLQAAIQGKLTEQLPSDGDARNLLTEIQTEKKRLIKAGTIKKEKPLPEITEDEIPFDIPDNWCWVRLGEIANIVGGGTPKTEEPQNWYKGNIPWLTPADMKNQKKYVSHGKRFISEYGLLHSSAQLMPAGSVLFSSRAPIGYIGITTDKVCTNQGFKSIVPYKMEINEYLYYAIMTITKFIEEMASGTTFKEVSGATVKLVVIPLPPLSEQKRIVERLEEILSAISALEKDENKLEIIQQSFPKRMKDSLLQAAIQGNLTEQLPSDGNARDLLADIQAEKKRLIKAGKIKKEKPLPEITEDEIPFDIPDNWCWVRLGDIFQINPRNTVEDDVEASFIPMTMLDEGYISKFCYEKKLWKNIKSGFTHFSDDDIVFAKITPCFQNLKSAVMKKLVNGIGAGTTELHVLRRFTKAVDLFYTLYFLKNPIFIQDGLNTVQGTAGQQRIGKEYIKKYLFPLPPLAEQKRIVRRLEELLPKCDALNYYN